MEKLTLKAYLFILTYSISAQISKDSIKAIIEREVANQRRKSIIVGIVDINGRQIFSAGVKDANNQQKPDTTLEQLRFQFYTNGINDFWGTHTKADAPEHIKNDDARYQFTATDPKIPLNALSIIGLWLFGEKDMQIPAKLCIEQVNAFKVLGKPFEYNLFSKLGHNTSLENDTAPVDIAIKWIKQKAMILSYTCQL